MAEKQVIDPSSVEANKYAGELNDEVTVLETGEVVNASGHVQELNRQYGLLSIAALSIVVGCCWAVFGGTVVISLYNGGPTGIIYEFLAAGAFYIVIACSLAELASAVPSSGGVYHWASVTPGRKWGRPLGFFAGWWNLLAWTFGGASLAVTVAEALVQMYALKNPTFTPERWNIFMASLLLLWLCAFTTIFANKFLPQIFAGMAVLVLGGWFVTVIVLAVMPSTHEGGYATSDFIWKTFLDEVGYAWGNGMVFLTGMLNGAFAMSTADGSTHFAEETHHPATNIPKAMGIQMLVSYLTTFFFMVALFYGISDLDDIFDAESKFPLLNIYLQATGSNAGAIGLTVLVALALLGSVMLSLLTAARTFWTLSRDHATPFPSFFSKVSKRWDNPIYATLFIGFIGTVILCIFMGSSTAYSAFVSSFVMLLTFSYLACLLPFLLKKRRSVVPGPFYLKGAVGYIVNIISVTYLVIMMVFYCFPYEMPVDAENMNYSSLMVGGFTILIGLGWFWCQGRYKGPQIVMTGWGHHE